MDILKVDVEGAEFDALVCLFVLSIRHSEIDAESVFSRNRSSMPTVDVHCRLVNYNLKSTFGEI